MKSNIGSIDRAIRLLLAMLLVVFFYTRFLEGIWGVISLVMALTLTVTSLLSYCPLYKIFNKSTIYNKNEEGI